MTVVDSSGWLAYFAGEALAEAYGHYIEDEEVLVPSVVLYEVYKVLRRDASEEAANCAAVAMRAGTIVPLGLRLAIEAAETSLDYGLAFADAIVYATAQVFGAASVTSDRHFEGLEGVEYLPKPNPSHASRR